MQISGSYPVILDMNFWKGGKNLPVGQASWGMYLKFGNYGFRSHLNVALYPSQLHQKGVWILLPKCLR